MKTVEDWFNEKIRTGAIARDTVVHNHAFAAKNALIAELTAAKDDADVPALVSVWYQRQLVTGMLARNAEASQQAEDAKSDLIGRLTPQAAPLPIKSSPPPAAPAATSEKE